MSFASLAALYAAGLATFASPCVLPLLPLYLALLGSRSSSRARLALAGLGFALGLSLVFVALGMGASVFASTFASHRRVLLLVAGGALIVLGFQALGVFRLRALAGDVRPLLARVPAPGGFFGGVLFGGAFSLGWTPCVGPVLGAALSYSASHSASPAVAATELTSYALGLSTPLVLAALGAPRVLELARRLRGVTPLIQRVTGVALLGMGVLLAADRVGTLSPSSAGRAPSAPDCAVSGAQTCSVGETLGATDAPADLPTGRPHLVEFVSGHCTVCAKMAPVVAELERACTSGDGTIVRVNVDEPRGRALAARFGVRAVPTFVELDGNGLEIERVIGEKSRSELALA
ncbi:MAG TPA: cytochrome c biogenesis protein CcdA, partial [Polyangiaceae bacterium]|nr:cytochrome c biogenesis protein CcdA [Polyangiaceae bacterium]